MDKAVTYLTNNDSTRRDAARPWRKAWPIATGMIEAPGDRHRRQVRHAGARRSSNGAETILKLRAVVVNGDLDDDMNDDKKRLR